MVITAIVASFIFIGKLIDWHRDHWYFTGTFLLGCNFVLMTYLAAYIGLPQRKFAVVAIGLLVPLFLGAIYFASHCIREPSAFQGSIIWKIKDHTLISIAVLGIQLWLFRCWKILGYSPVIHVRGKGFLFPNVESPDNNALIPSRSRPVQ